MWPGPSLTTAIWHCHNPFSQWQCSFQRKLRCHWLKFLRQHHVTVIRQGPGPVIIQSSVMITSWHKLTFYITSPLCREYSAQRASIVLNKQSSSQWPIMAFRCHMVTQCWLIISEGLWYSPESNCAVSAQVAALYNECENYIFKMTTSSS